MNHFQRSIVNLMEEKIREDGGSRENLKELLSGPYLSEILSGKKELRLDLGLELFVILSSGPLPAALNKELADASAEQVASGIEALITQYAAELLADLGSRRNSDGHVVTKEPNWRNRSDFSGTSSLFRQIHRAFLKRSPGGAEK